MKYACIFFVLIPFLSFTQNEKEDCWRCLVAVRNKAFDKVYEECEKYTQANVDSVNSGVAALMIARTLLEEGKFKKALSTLADISLKQDMVQAIVEGLKGDCHSELGDHKAAISNYEKAVNADYNELTGPYYLFKSYLEAKALNDLGRAKSYLSSVAYFYPNSYMAQNIDKYEADWMVAPFGVITPEIEQPKDGYGIGTLNGKRIDEQFFLREYNKQQEIADMNSRMQGRSPAAIEMEEVYRLVVNELLLTKSYVELGITLSAEELDAYIYATDGFEPMPDLYQNFKTRDGQFDRNSLRMRINELIESSDEQQREIWNNYEESLGKRRMLEKLSLILTYGVYTTKLHQDFAFDHENVKKEVRYWVKEFKDQSDVDVSETALRDFYEEKKDDPFLQVWDDFKEVMYCELPIVPSAKDSSQVIKEMQELIKPFKQAPNDSLFVLEHSAKKVFTAGPFATAVPDGHPDQGASMFAYPREMQTTFLKAKKGDVVGPYKHGDRMNLAKVLGFTEDSIRARHLLIAEDNLQPGRTEQLVDSLLKVINDANFADLAARYSVDHGSKRQGGDLGYFFFSKMVAPFAIFCAESPIGKIGIVRSQFGMHIVQVTDRRGPKHPRVAMIEKALLPSQETLDEIDAFAHGLNRSIIEEAKAMESGREKVDFFKSVMIKAGFKPSVEMYRDKEIKNVNLDKRVFESFLMLAYSDSAQLGSMLSNPVKLSDKYVLAVMAGEKKKGRATFEDIKDLLLIDYSNQEKAKKLKTEMANVDDLDDVRNGVKSTEVTFNYANFSNLGTENELIGMIYNELEDGQLSAPFAGRNGVYRVQVVNSTRVDLKDEVKGMINQQFMTLFTRMLLPSLYFRAQAIDNRALFFAGVRK